MSEKMTEQMQDLRDAAQRLIKLLDDDDGRGMASWWSAIANVRNQIVLWTPSGERPAPPVSFVQGALDSMRTPGQSGPQDVMAAAVRKGLLSKRGLDKRGELKGAPLNQPQLERAATYGALVALALRDASGDDDEKLAANLPDVLKAAAELADLCEKVSDEVRG